MVAPSRLSCRPRVDRNPEFRSGAIRDGAGSAQCSGGDRRGWRLHARPPHHTSPPALGLDPVARALVMASIRTPAPVPHSAHFRHRDFDEATPWPYRLASAVSARLPLGVGHVSRKHGQPSDSTQDLVGAGTRLDPPCGIDRPTGRDELGGKDRPASGLRDFRTMSSRISHLDNRLRPHMPRERKQEIPK